MSTRQVGAMATAAQRNVSKGGSYMLQGGTYLVPLE